MVDTTCNRIVLNIPQVLGGMDNPEPDLAAVIIDGIGLKAVNYIQIQAQAGALTQVTVRFEAEVSGVFKGQPIADIMRGRDRD